MNESEGRGVELATATESYTASNSRSNARRYSSPNRVLARSMRISRDNWKIKHQAVQEKLEQERQLSADRGLEIDQWKQKCDRQSPSPGDDGWFVTAIVASHL